MSLITLNVDESIKDELLKTLKQFPDDKLEINSEPVLDEEEVMTFEVITDLEEDLEEELYDMDYFFNEKDEIINFKIEIEDNGDEVDAFVKEVRIIFETGDVFFGYFAVKEEVMYSVEDEGYYFGMYVVVDQIDEDTIRKVIKEMIYSEEFMDAFEKMDFIEDDLDDIDPIRLN